MQNKTKKKLSLSYKTTFKTTKSRPIPLLYLLSSSLLYIPSRFRPFSSFFWPLEQYQDMVGFRRPRLYNPQEEKTKNKPSFLKKIFLILLLYFSSLWPPFLLSIQTFWKRANSFWKMPTILFLFNQYLYHYYLSIIILLHTRRKKNRSSYSTYLYTTDSTLSTTSQYWCI